VALIRQVARPGFPGAVPCGVRTFLDPMLALKTATARQPEDKGIIPSIHWQVISTEKNQQSQFET